MKEMDNCCPWCNKKDIYPNQYCSEFCRRHYIKWINELADSLDQLLFAGPPAHIEFNKLFASSDMDEPQSFDKVI